MEYIDNFTKWNTLMNALAKCPGPKDAPTAARGGITIEERAIINEIDRVNKVYNG